MAKVIPSKAYIERCRKDFHIELAKIIELQPNIAIKEYGGVQHVANNYKHFLRLRLEQINPNPMRDSTAKIDDLKNKYKRAFNKLCKALTVLLQHDPETKEVQEFAEYLFNYVQRLINKNVKNAWDELYNFSDILKNLAIDFPEFKFIEKLRRQTVTPALDQYFDAKEAKAVYTKEQSNLRAITVNRINVLQELFEVFEARKLKQLQQQHHKQQCLALTVYYEKPDPWTILQKQLATAYGIHIKC